MSKNFNDYNLKKSVEKICDAFGISNENVNLTHKKSDDGNSEFIECLINLIGGEGEEENVKETTKEEDIDDATFRLLGAWQKLLRAVKEESEDDDEDDVVDDSECGETYCCNCGTPCCIENDETCECRCGSGSGTETVECRCVCGSGTETVNGIPSANNIKESIRKKFEDVIIHQRNEKNRRQFYQDLKDEILRECVAKIQKEEYQSLTNDVDADGSGIGIMLSEEWTTNLELNVRRKYDYQELMDWEYLEGEVLCGLAHEIANRLGFSDAIGYVDDMGRTFVKLWF